MSWQPPRVVQRRPKRTASGRCPQRDSNPRYSLERAVTWAASRWGPRKESTGCLLDAGVEVEVDPSEALGGYTDRAGRQTGPRAAPEGLHCVASAPQPDRVPAGGARLDLSRQAAVLPELEDNPDRRLLARFDPAHRLRRPAHDDAVEARLEASPSGRSGNYGGERQCGEREGHDAHDRGQCSARAVKVAADSHSTRGIVMRGTLPRGVHTLRLCGVGAVLAVAFAAVGASQADSATARSGPEFSEAVAFDTSKPLRELAKTAKAAPRQKAPQAVPERGPIVADAGFAGDAAVQAEVAPLAIGAPIANFEGLSNQDNFNIFGGRVNPPDPVGDVGPNHYVEMVNLMYGVYSKTGRPAARAG